MCDCYRVFSYDCSVCEEVVTMMHQHLPAGVACVVMEFIAVKPLFDIIIEPRVMIKRIPVRYHITHDPLIDSTHCVKYILTRPPSERECGVLLLLAVMGNRVSPTDIGLFTTPEQYPWLHAHFISSYFQYDTCDVYYGSELLSLD